MARYNPRKEKDFKRVGRKRELKQSFLIICEGINTEPEYFKAFRLTSASVKAIGEGLGTTRLVEEAIIVKELETRKHHVYDQYWVVFDKDQSSDETFSKAIKLAEKNGFKVAYSNQAFEYWFLLHFNLYQGKIHRERYEEMLSKASGIAYSKKEGFITKFFQLLEPYQLKAIERASKILAEFNGLQPAKAESSTTVHELVNELNKFR